MSVGVRVVRGPDWDQNEADGGEGHLGTVAGVKAEEGTAEVVWDNGQVTTCRVGKEGKHDLRILDNGPAGVQHPRHRCDGCNRYPIHGTRWVCALCPEFDLCSLCYVMGKHDLSHDFHRFSKDTGQGVPVGRRSAARKLRVVGIFPGARVSRGRDWLAANADGGAGGVGTVVEVVSPESNSARNAVKVNWDSGQSVQHRLGLHGKVDLVLVQESRVRPFVYLDHLPLLDEEYAGGRREDKQIRVGDSVVVEVDEQTFADIQRQGSGWSVGMSKCLGQVGVVKALTPRGEVDVDFAGQKWRISRVALRKGTQATREEIREGDTVRLLEDLETVKQLQVNHGGWNDAIKTCLGKVGRVTKVHGNGNLKVSFGVFDWHLNPLACRLAPGCQPEVPDLGDPEFLQLVQSQMRSQLGSMLPGSALTRDFGAKVKGEPKGDDIPPSLLKLIKAILSGDLGKIRTYLDREPGLVHQAANQETPLHYAAEAGEAEVASLLLDRGADVNKADKEDDTPLMLAANKGQLAVARVLLERGADVRLSNENGRTALHKAAWRGSAPLCRLLMDHGAPLQAKDVKGNTPPLVAVDDEDHAEALEVLLTSPEVNMYHTNRKDFNILHVAAYRGRPKCTEVILRRESTLVNCPTQSEQWGAIHIAAVNDHSQVLRLLLQAGAAVNARNHQNVAPLHLASKNSHIDCVMMLVEHGADLDIQDDEGNTPLHKALGTESDGRRRSEESRLQVANYLLHRGASVELRNGRGQTALEVASSSLRPRVAAFLQERGGTGGGGKMPPESPTPARQPTPPKAPQEGSKPPQDQTAQGMQETVAAMETPCVTCSKKEACVVFLPCAHKVTCMDCAHAHSTCPTCQVDLIGKVDLDGNSLPSRPPQSVPQAKDQAQKNLDSTPTAEDKKCVVQ